MQLVQLLASREDTLVDEDAERILTHKRLQARPSWPPKSPAQTAI